MLYSSLSKHQEDRCAICNHDLVNMQQLMMVEGNRQYVTSRKALTTDLQYEPFRRMRKSLEQGPGHVGRS